MCIIKPHSPRFVSELSVCSAGFKKFTMISAQWSQKLTWGLGSTDGNLGVSPLCPSAGDKRDTGARAVPYKRPPCFCACLFRVALSVKAGGGGEENTTDLLREETDTWCRRHWRWSWRESSSSAAHRTEVNQTSRPDFDPSQQGEDTGGPGQVFQMDTTAQKSQLKVMFSASHTCPLPRWPLLKR